MQLLTNTRRTALLGAVVDAAPMPFIFKIAHTLSSVCAVSPGGGTALAPLALSEYHSYYYAVWWYDVTEIVSLGIVVLLLLLLQFYFRHPIHTLSCPPEL